MLLRRPHTAGKPCNRSTYSETVNDADGLLVNAWRSIQLSPDATAEAASWPVSEADLFARHLAIVRWRAERNLELLMGDPAWHDPVMGGWWIWGMSAWIGGGWGFGTGAWTADRHGRIYKQERGTREPGVKSVRPQLTDNGQGVNRPGTREPGVASQLPYISNDGRGVNRPGTREPGVGEPEWHPMTMPEVRRWFGWLCARLRHVRILNGDWRRAATDGALKTLSVRTGGGCAGIFLDPPYGNVRCDGLYANDSLTVAVDVRRWCTEHGDDPKLRIVLAGFDVEHSELEAFGWRVVEWFIPGFLRGGLGNMADSGTNQQHRERLWLSPACLDHTCELHVHQSKEAALAAFRRMTRRR